MVCCVSLEIHSPKKILRHKQLLQIDLSILYAQIPSDQASAAGLFKVSHRL